MFATLKLTFVVMLFAVAAKAETYVFAAQGFSLKAPDGWHVMAVADTVRAVEGSDFGEELKNAGNPASQLLVVVRDNPIVGVSPGVFVNYHPGTIADINVGLGRVADILRRNLREFQMVQDPTADRLGPYEAGMIRYSYVTQIGSVDHTVVETFWLIPDGDHYATISGGLSPVDEAAVHPLIEAMAHSMKGL